MFDNELPRETKEILKEFEIIAPDNNYTLMLSPGQKAKNNKKSNFL